MDDGTILYPPKLYEEGIPADASPTWGDWLKQGEAAAESTGADVSYGLSAIGHYMGDEYMARMNARTARPREQAAQDTMASMTAAGRNAATTWDHPMNALPMRIIGMLPPAAATVIPAAFLEGPAAVAWMAGTGALLGAGGYHKALSQWAQGASDEQLQTAPLYKEFRSMGMDEVSAKDAYALHLATEDGNMAVAALANAVASVGGGPAQLVRGPVKSMLAHGLEAGAAGAVGAGVPTYLESDKLQSVGGPSLDVAGPTIEAGLLNAAIGAAAGGARGAYGHGSDRNYQKEGKANATPASKVEVLDDKGPDLDASIALASRNPPAPPEPPKPVAPAPEPSRPVAATIEPAATPVAPEAPPAPEATAPKEPPPVPTAPATTGPALAKLTNGEVAAVVFKPGEEVPRLPSGFNKVQVGTDLYYFNPGKVTRGAIEKAIREDTIGRYLGLTDVSKTEATTRAAQGETPAAVVERTPEGTEVKAAAGTDQTAPGQVAQMEAAKTPGNVVGVEDPNAVIQQRLEAQPAFAPGSPVKPVPKPPAPIGETLAPAPAPSPPPKAPKGVKAKAISKAKEEVPTLNPTTPEARQQAEELAARLNAKLTSEGKQGRVLSDVSPEGVERAQEHVAQEGAQREALTTAAAKAEAKIERAANPVGSKRSKDEIATRQSHNDIAKEVVDAHAPLPAEAGYGKGAKEDANAKEAIRFRAKAMVDAAEARGVEIPKIDKSNTDASANWNAQMLLLRKARTLSKKKYPTKSDYDDFVTSDLLGRAGERDLMAQTDRAENDTRFGKSKVNETAAEVPEPSDAPSHPTEEARHPDDVTHEGKDEPAAEGLPDQEDEFDIDPRETAAPQPAFAAREETTPADKYAKMAAERGEADAGPVAGGAKHKFEVATTKRRVPVSKKVAPLQVGKDWTIPVANEGVSLPVTSMGEMRDVLSQVRADKHPLVKELVRRLDAQIGDMDVHFVEQSNLDALFPADKKIYGFYDPEHNHIVLSASLPRGQEVQVVLHEALHGALYQRIEADPKAKVLVRRMMNEFKKANIGDFYALKNEHEFVSEVLANPDIRTMALASPLSSRLASELGLFARTARNLWNGVLETFRRMLGLPAAYRSVLDGIVAVSDQLGLGEKRGDEPRSSGELQPIQASDLTDAPASVKRRSELLSKVGDQIAEASRASGATLSEKWHQYAPKFMSNDQLRQAREHLFGDKSESNPARKLVDGIERANTYMRKLLIPATKLAGRMATARVKYEGEGWDTFVDLMHQSTLHGVHPDAPLDSGANSHLKLSKKGGDDASGNYAHWQARAQHPKLAQMYASLPKELQELYQQARDYYTADRNGRIREAIGSIIDGAPEEPTHDTREKIADRVFEREMTDEDEAYLNQFENLGKVLRKAQDVQRLKGPYFPLKRRGEYVVRAEHDIKTPKGATREGNDFLFDSREEAHAFATSHDLPTRVGKAYYDPETGDRLKSRMEGVSTAGTPTEKYVVHVENGHIEFAETEREAEALRQALIDAGMKNVKNLDLKEKHEGVSNALHSAQLNLLTKAIERNTKLDPSERGKLIDTLHDASIGMQRGNRIEQHYLRRKGMSGASRDVLTNLSDYSHASAAFRSRAKYRSEIDGALDEMRGKIGDDEHTLDRRRTVQEYETRLMGFGSPEYTGPMAPAWQKLMTLSFIKRMASPAHLALHMMHPIMTSIPVVSGRFGLNNTYRAFAQAYKDMGAGGALVEAGRGFKRAWKGGDPTNFGDYFRKSISETRDAAELTKMFDALEDTGHLHPDSGFDISRFNEQKSGFDRGLRRVDETFRELTSGTESINRYGTAIAVYRLARKADMSPEQAIRFVKDTISNTQGLYSATNAAPFFRNPATRPFLQFKQYPAMIAHLLARMTHQAFKGESPEAKAEAVKGLALMLGTATTLTGLAGLPNDVEKIMLILGNSLGVTPSYGEWEDSERRWMTQHFGPELSKLVVHGVMSMGPTGVSASHRLGFANMLSFGEPSSDKPEDLRHWVMDTALGAPGSMFSDNWEGAVKLMHGDIVDAAEKMAPAKIIDDLIKAGMIYSEGKKTDKGKEWMKPVGPGAAAVQAFGFVPQVVADTGAARHFAYDRIKKQRDEEITKKEKAGLGYKGRRILGIAETRKNRRILNESTDAYGVQR